jgi:2-oxoglutarate ferredoxin oxidoreductase subunit delta
VEITSLTKKKPRSLVKNNTHVPFIADHQEDVVDWEIFVIPDRCKGCEICVYFCPREILEEDMETLNVKGYHPPRLKPGASTTECAGCLFCQLICPEFAIFIQEAKEETSK